MELLNKFMHWMEKRGSHRDIYRMENGKPVLYLRRYYMVKFGDSFQILMHKFFRGDVGPLHDHPNSSFGWILRGGYWETLCQGLRSGIPHNTYWVWREPGLFKVGHRPAGNFDHSDYRAYHKVSLNDSDIDTGHVVTLFITGKRTSHSWGFATDRGYVHFVEHSKNERVMHMQVAHTDYRDWFFPVNPAMVGKH